MSYTYIMRIASAKNVLRAEPTIYLLIIGTTCSNQQFNDKKCYSSAYCIQGRIYVANEYPTFARTIWIVCQKLGICIKITLDGRENLSIWMGNMQILG